ncbi:MAG: hypothetical protein IKW45_02355 [Clostridia bacterium]|nr:hypothetical protein [Clostridia bacterium]
MANIERGDQRKYYQQEASRTNIGDMALLANEALNTGMSITQKANESTLANNQIDLSTKFLAKNNEINTKYQADPTNPEREVELQEAFEELANSYEINPLCQGQWHTIKNNVYNRYKTHNAEWVEKQQNINIETNLKNGYEALTNQISMLGLNGSSVDEMRLIYANGIEGLRTSATARLGSVVVDNFLKDADHDVMTTYISAMALNNPLEAQRLLQDEGVRNDIGRAETLEKLDNYVATSLSNQQKRTAVAELGTVLRSMNSQEADDIINGKADLNKVMRFIESNKNLPEGSKDLVLDMYGIGKRTEYYYDRDKKKIVKNDEAGSGSSTRLTALKKLSKSDKEDLAVDLESQLYDLFSFEETKKVNPKRVIKKGQAEELQGGVLERMQMVAEAQGQIDQAWNAGVITKAKRQELMSKFIEPMSDYLENNLMELDERQGFIGSKLGYDKLKKAFSTEDIPESHTAKIRAKKQEMLIAQGAYYSTLDAYKKKLNLQSIYDIENLPAEQQREIYKTASEEAIKYAQKHSSHPEYYFKSQYPQLYNQGVALFGTKDGDMVARHVATKIYNAPEGEKIDVKKEFSDSIVDMKAKKKQEATDLVNSIIAVNKRYYAERGNDSGFILREDMEQRAKMLGFHSLNEFEYDAIHNKRVRPEQYLIYLEEKQREKRRKGK